MPLCSFLLRRIRTVDRGCQPAPGLPCALSIQEGEEIKQSSGEISREDAKACLGGVGWVEHLRNPSCFNTGEVLMGFAALYPSYELRPNSALMPRTQRSASSAMRCRAGAHVAANAVASWVPALRSSVRSLQRVRDTRVVGAGTSHSVTAFAQQSRRYRDAASCNILHDAGVAKSTRLARRQLRHQIIA